MKGLNGTSSPLHPPKNHYFPQKINTTPLRQSRQSPGAQQLTDHLRSRLLAGQNLRHYQNMIESPRCRYLTVSRRNNRNICVHSSETDDRLFCSKRISNHLLFSFESITQPIKSQFVTPVESTAARCSCTSERCSLCVGAERHMRC